jgi:hypothetical protein
MCHPKLLGSAFFWVANFHHFVDFLEQLGELCFRSASKMYVFNQKKKIDTFV